MSTYRLTLATEATRDLVVEALRAEAGKRTRVAVKASLSVAADRLERRDVRSASVRVTALLAEAAQLGQLADELADADALPIITQGPHVAQVAASADTHDGTLTPLEEHIVEATAEGNIDDLDAALLDALGDDGLSPAAQAAMTQAQEFTERYLDDPDGTDVDTGATAEDDDTDPADTTALEEALKP